ncbi:hypothetical protein NSQ26_06020 [Bacillus sp. FSL W7-1360]
MHLQAWLNVQANSTKESGKKVVPVFKKFKDFFDYEKRLKEVVTPHAGKLHPTWARMAKIAAVTNAREEGENGREL